MGRSAEIGGDRHLHMQVVERPWKISGRRAGTVGAGDSLRYVTAISTATCGIQPEIGAIYVTFALPDASDPTLLRVDMCSGTRIHRAESGGDPIGFVDVPGRFVASQLDALSGLDALRDVAASAPDGADPANTTLVGLLDLDALAHGGIVRVYERPDTSGAIHSLVRSYEELESREVGYEVGAAVVFARVGRWSRVRLGDGTFGWIAQEHAGTFFPYEDLPVRRLTYLTGAWSGHAWPEPGAGIPVRSTRFSDDPGAEYAVDVHESRVVGGMLWFRVDVLTASPCDGGDARVAFSGWVPGYGARGEPTVWYYSRGC
jgi:hypothetical protein